MINNKPIIYYKDGQLNRIKTAKSILRYYIKCRIGGKVIHKISFTSVIDS